MLRVALFILVMVGVMFFIWRAARRPGEGDAPADFAKNIREDFTKLMERLGALLPYILLAGLFVAAYFFFTNANFF
ncbi:MAG: hypothetical protein AAF141_07335 [Pseudomonadota bacterium]